MKIHHGKFWTVALVLTAALALHGKAATVTATLDPSEISMGESTQLTVTVSGAQDQPEKPNVDGLEITPVGQSTQIEIINGSVTSNASSTYSVTPQHEGAFTIPAIHAGNAASEPITLKVGKGSVSAAPAPAQSSSVPSNGPVVLPPPSTPSSPGAEPAPADKFGSVEIAMPKKEFYEGELVPIVIKVFIPQDVQPNLNDLPQFTSDGFTLNSLSTKLDQSAQVLNGRVYDVLTWHSALTAVKTGEYPISLKVPLTVVEFQQMPMPANPDDMFNNFFRNAFSAMGRKKDVTLTNKPETLKVVPLPQANRPADFSGAVGQFDAEAGAIPTKVNAGDPITLQMKVSGTGNFDRVSSDMLPANAQWKTYSVKNRFEGEDSVGYQGTKTFEQPVIPGDSSVTRIPSLSFSYFDPETKQYVTRMTAPIAVSVTGGVAAPIASTAAPAATSPAQSPSPTPAPVPALDLRPNQIEPGVFASTLRPVYLSPLFVAGQSLPLLALLSGLFLIRSRRQATQPARVQAAATQRAIREQVEAMDAAMRNHQTGEFFIRARCALQQRLGQRWNLKPETITLAEVDARGDAVGANVRPIFEMADQASYSDLHLDDADLQQWHQAVMNELAEKN